MGPRCNEQLLEKVVPFATSIRNHFILIHDHADLTLHRVVSEWIKLDLELLACGADLNPIEYPWDQHKRTVRHPRLQPPTLQVLRFVLTEECDV